VGRKANDLKEETSMAAGLLKASESLIDTGVALLRASKLKGGDGYEQK